MYLTLKQCSELTEINISSCRYYKDTYLSYFKTQGEGKSTKFEKDSTVEILNIIRASYVKGLDHDQIVGILDNKFGVTVTDLATQEMNNNTETTQQEDLMQSIHQLFISELNRRDELILELQEELQEIKESLLKQDERNENRHRRLEERDNRVMEQLRKLNEKKWWRWR